MKFISSHENPLFKKWHSLLSRKGLRKEQEFLLSGKALTLEVLQQRPDAFTDILISDHATIQPQLQDWLAQSPHPLKTHHLSEGLFQQLDVLGTKNPLLVGRQPHWPQADLSAPPSGLEVLCPLGDPSNLGALLRSCEAFSVSKVILLKEAAHPFHPKTLKASAGSSLRLDLQQGPSIQELQNHLLHIDNSSLIALDLRGKSIQNFTWPKNCRLLLGEEGPGIPSPLRQKTESLSIPMAKPVESLNATVAASLVLWHWKQQNP